MQRRQVLLWAIAAERQLDRWEALVMEHVAGRMNPNVPRISDARIWQGETEHHFAVVAMDHMLEALRVWTVDVPLPPLVVQEVAEVRDLATHWKDNMPVFNMSPRPREPKHSTGKSFAARNPARGPYFWTAWTSERGPMLTPNVSGADARRAVEQVRDAVLAVDPNLTRFVPGTDQPS